MSFNFNYFFNVKFFLIILNFYSLIFYKKKNFKCVGKGHGKYFIPNSFFNLNCKSKWVLSAGIGDDISFDKELLELDYKIIFVDPTPEAIHFFNENFDKKKYLKKFYFFENALWHKNEKIKFFSSDDDEIISHSVANTYRSDNFIEVDTITLDYILNKTNINEFALMKIDIEGAELNVINDLIKKKISTKLLLIEFDFLKQKNIFKSLVELTAILKKLRKHNYKLIFIDDLNFTFSNYE